MQMKLNLKRYFLPLSLNRMGSASLAVHSSISFQCFPDRIICLHALNRISRGAELWPLLLSSCRQIYSLLGFFRVKKNPPAKVSEELTNQWSCDRCDMETVFTRARTFSSAGTEGSCCTPYLGSTSSSCYDNALFLKYPGNEGKSNL